MHNRQDIEGVKSKHQQCSAHFEMCNKGGFMEYAKCQVHYIVF